MAYAIRYTRPPGMSISMTCGGLSCGTGTVEHDGDSFHCTDCGTIWHEPDGDGELYEPIDGESTQGEAIDPDTWPGRIVDARWSS